MFEDMVLQTALKAKWKLKVKERRVKAFITTTLKGGHGLTAGEIWAKGAYRFPFMTSFES